MRRVMEEYSSSGVPRRQFCEQRGLSLTTFDYWRRELRPQPRMVQVEVAGNQSAPAGVMPFIVTLANGRRIESSWQFDETQLARLIRLVESA